MSNPNPTQKEIKQVSIVLEGKMNYDEEWTELDDAQDVEHANRLIRHRMKILSRADEKYNFRPDEQTPGQVNVFYNERLQRIYRVRAK